MANEIAYTTPCDLLAKKTVARLVSEGLISAKYSSEVLNLLAGGASRPEDWKLLIEKTIEIEEKGGLDGHR
jgi:hypothetical protein